MRIFSGPKSLYNKLLSFTFCKVSLDFLTYSGKAFGEKGMCLSQWCRDDTINVFVHFNPFEKTFSFFFLDSSGDLAATDSELTTRAQILNYNKVLTLIIDTRSSASSLVGNVRIFHDLAHNYYVVHCDTCTFIQYKRPLFRTRAYNFSYIHAWEMIGYGYQLSHTVHYW